MSLLQIDLLDHGRADVYVDGAYAENIEATPAELDRLEREADQSDYERQFG